MFASVIRETSDYEATWESLANYTVPEWYQDANSGFSSIGVSIACRPFGNEWYPRNMYIEGSPEFEHHRERWGPTQSSATRILSPCSKRKKFDPAHWADLFKRSGARYVVPVAEHHDGFAMYDCSFSRWTAAKMGPKRDIIGELAAAVRKEGLAFGVSSHRAEHWWFFNGGMTFDSDVRDPQYADFYGPAAPGPIEHTSEAWRSRDWTPGQTPSFLRTGWPAPANWLTNTNRNSFGLTGGLSRWWSSRTYRDSQPTTITVG